MKRTFLGAFAAAAIAVLGVVALDTGNAASADMSAIKQRIDFMKNDVLGPFKVIKAYVSDGKGSLEGVEKAAKELQAAAGKITPLFPKGTGRPDVDEKKTRALSKIWDEWDKFEAASKALGEHAGHVAMYAAEGDADEVKKHFGFAGKQGCGACHKAFRGKKAE